jgi:hypothetical protein
MRTTAKAISGLFLAVELGTVSVPAYWLSTTRHRTAGTPAASPSSKKTEVRSTALSLPSTRAIRLEIKSRDGRAFHLDSLHSSRDEACRRAHWRKGSGYETRITLPDGTIVQPI